MGKKSDALLPYIYGNDTEDVARESGRPIAAVRPQMGWLHRDGMIEQVGTRLRTSDRGNTYEVPVFART